MMKMIALSTSKVICMNYISKIIIYYLLIIIISTSKVILQNDLTN